MHSNSAWDEFKIWYGEQDISLSVNEKAHVRARLMGWDVKQLLGLSPAQHECVMNTVNQFVLRDWPPGVKK